MSENWKIQVSPKLADGTLINLRAETADEAERLFTWAMNNAGKVIGAVQAFSAVNTLAAAGVTGTVIDNAPANTAPQWAQSQAPSQPYPSVPTQQGPRDPERTCDHGDRKYVTGNGPKGAWAAWMCPTPKGTPGQCAPKWIN